MFIKVSRFVFGFLTMLSGYSKKKQSTERFCTFPCFEDFLNIPVFGRIYLLKYNNFFSQYIRIADNNTYVVNRRLNHRLFHLKGQIRQVA